MKTLKFSYARIDFVANKGSKHSYIQSVQIIAYEEIGKGAKTDIMSCMMTGGMLYIGTLAIGINFDKIIR